MAPRRIPSSARRPAASAMVVVRGTALAALMVVVPAPPVEARTPSRVEAGPSLRALALLHAWDERRAASWAVSDAEGLVALYGPGSRTGQGDVALLRAYRERGLTVLGLRQQVFEVTEVVWGRHEVVLSLVDRLAGGAVLGQGRCRALPSERPRRRVIVLQRDGGRWQVDEVTQRG